jgi:hypothetical protein
MTPCFSCSYLREVTSMGQSFFRTNQTHQLLEVALDPKTLLYLGGTLIAEVEMLLQAK